eukprot:5270833-Pleurochrysis_carterae.AAC.1
MESSECAASICRRAAFLCNKTASGRSGVHASSRVQRSMHAQNTRNNTWEGDKHAASRREVRSEGACDTWLACACLQRQTYVRASKTRCVGSRAADEFVCARAK